MPDWPEIAKSINRSPYCIRRKAVHLGFVLRRQHYLWSDQERERFRTLIQNNTHNNIICWKYIRPFFPNFTSRALYQYARIFQMTPNQVATDTDNWIAEQNNLLTQLVTENRKLSRKMDWNAIASKFSNKTQMQCENQARRLKLIKYDQAQWTAEEKASLVKYVLQIKKLKNFISFEEWQQIASLFNNRSALSCRSKWLSLNQAHHYMTAKSKTMMSSEYLQKLNAILYKLQLNSPDSAQKRIKWAQISKYLPPFSNQQCRSAAHYHHFRTYEQYNLDENGRKTYLKILNKSKINGKIQWGQVQVRWANVSNNSSLGGEKQLLNDKKMLKSENECSLQQEKEMKQVSGQQARWACRQAAVQNGLLPPRFW